MLTILWPSSPKAAGRSIRNRPRTTIERIQLSYARRVQKKTTPPNGAAVALRSTICPGGDRRASPRRLFSFDPRAAEDCPAGGPPALGSQVAGQPGALPAVAGFAAAHLGAGPLEPLGSGPEDSAEAGSAVVH